MSASSLIGRLPKAELHVHLEGTIEPGDMFTFARRNGVGLPWPDEGALRAAYSYRRLADFLQLFWQGCTVLQTREDLRDLALNFLTRASREGVRRAEIFFSPQNFLDRIRLGDQLDALTSAFEDARSDLSIDAALLVVAQRHRSETEALDLLEMMHPHRNRVLGVGLAGPENGNPPAKFARFFAVARDQGYRLTAHAGEEAPADYIRQALQLCRVERIDHGLAAIDDPDVLARLAGEQIPLTMCPLSNLRLQLIADLDDYPIRKFLAAGVPVTVNSDDPAYFGGYLTDNYQALIDALNLMDSEIISLVRSGFTSSFAEPDAIAAALAVVEAATA